MSLQLKDSFIKKLPNRFEYTEIDGKHMEAYKAEITARIKKKQRRWTAIVTLTALLCTIFFILIAFLAVASKTVIRRDKESISQICDGECSLELVETIPSGMKYDPGTPENPAIVDRLKTVLNSARKSIDIASSYWTLRGSDVKGGPYPQAKVGEEIFDGLIEAATKRGKLILSVVLIS